MYIWSKMVIQKWVTYPEMSVLSIYGFSPPTGVFMGIIYMDFYYNRWDDMILSMSPLILLFFITQVDDVLKYLIVAMIVSNVTYWNCKNIYTFTLDSLFATTFIAYLFYKCMKLKQNMYVLLALLLVTLYYFRVSYIKGRKGERQLYEHIAFRIVVFALFLYYVVSKKNEKSIEKSWPAKKWKIDWKIMAFRKKNDSFFHDLAECIKSKTIL